MHRNRTRRPARFLNETGAHHATNPLHASGLTADNADKLKDAGMNVPGVKWVNINNGNVVVTHDDSFDADAFAAALHGTDGSVSLSR